MSGDAATVRYGLPSGACRLCDRDLDDDDQQLYQLYRDETASIPFDRRALSFCRDCRDAVSELVDTWTTVPEPPVDASSIAVGYDRVADDCSFCEEAISDQTPLGIECYRAGTDHEGGLGAVRHFVLCPHCVDVFAEFLRTSSEG